MRVSSRSPCTTVIVSQHRELAWLRVAHSVGDSSHHTQTVARRRSTLLLPLHPLLSLTTDTRSCLSHRTQLMARRPIDDCFAVHGRRWCCWFQSHARASGSRCGGLRRQQRQLQLECRCEYPERLRPVLSLCLCLSISVLLPVPFPCLPHSGLPLSLVRLSIEFTGLSASVMRPPAKCMPAASAAGSFTG